MLVPHRGSNVSTGPYWEYLSSTHTCSVVQTEDDVTNSTFYIYYEDRYNIFMVAIVLVLIGRLPVTHMHVSININLLLGYQMYCIADM